MSILKNIILCSLITATITPSCSLAVLDVQVEEPTHAKGTLLGLSIKDIAMLTIGSAGVIIAGFFGYSYLKNRKSDASEIIAASMKKKLEKAPDVLEAINKTAGHPDTKKNLEAIASGIHKVVETCKTNLGTSLLQIRDDSTEILNALPSRSISIPVQASELPGLAKLGMQLGAATVQPEVFKDMQQKVTGVLDKNTQAGSTFLTPEAAAMLKRFVPAPAPQDQAAQRGSQQADAQQNAPAAQQPKLEEVLVQAMANPAIQRMMTAVATRGLSQQDAQAVTGLTDIAGVLNGLGLADLFKQQ